MRIEVINTGTELLLGKVTNTHLGYFGNELFKLGLRIQRQVCIPDGDDIRDVLLDSFPRSEVVLVTGGLGPTADDVTREVVADLLGLELRRDEAIIEHIEEIFRRRKFKNNPSNARQAMVPEGAVVLHNPNGTAPGLYLPATYNQTATVDSEGGTKSGTPHIFLLPGPPRELKPMFESEVMPRLRDLLPESAQPEAFRNFRIFNVGESKIASDLQDQFDEVADLEVGYCARLGEVDVRLIGEETAVDVGSAIVRNAYPSHIVTESEASIEEVIVRLLTEQKATVATAESCTGGAIASAITNVSGSSGVFHRGYVTYANEAKAELLGVLMELIETHGAVSEEVAGAMATGCLEKSGADHAIAVSGIAGPTGGTEEKPVGTVYIGLASKGHEVVVKHHLAPADRISFKARVTRLALDLLRRRLTGHPVE